MGYYTKFEFEVFQGNDFKTDYREELSEISGYNSSLVNSESIKWYDHEEHLKELSENHPNTVFKLSGEGEESNDLWIKYFKSGKMQECRASIVFEDFNLTKLV